jgi:enoyl-CoA hydratase/carnithine racemase
VPDADTSPAILVETQGDALWIRLNRPRLRNAYDAEMAGLIVDALQGANTFRSVVITGVQRSFCAGGSLSTLGAPTPGGLRGLYAASLRMFDAIRSCPRPVIAAVNGAAAGGGNELVVACDLAIAARSATFGQTGPRVGSAGDRGHERDVGADRREAREGTQLLVPPLHRRAGAGHGTGEQGRRR